MHGRRALLPNVSALAVRDDLRFGDTLIDPALRTVRGPSGDAALEPRVMQVLMALADADGAVVTRETLMARCWSGQLVGDDALTRTIFAIRRALKDVGSTGLGVETISKAGYRLIGTATIDDGGAPVDNAVQFTRPPDTAGLAAVEPPGAVPVSRRAVTVGAAGLAVAAAAGVVWWPRPDPNAQRAADLVARARVALRDELPESEQQGLGFLKEAVALAPANAEAWGTLALAWRNTAEYADPDETAAAVASTERAARKALALDPRQGDALAALATLAPIYGDWMGAERRLRGVLAVAPGNADALNALTVFSMATGRPRAQLALSEPLAKREPLSPTYQYHYVYGLWANGRAAEADRVVGRAMALWPRHPGVWLARLQTLAFTGRTAAALRLIEQGQQRQPGSPYLDQLAASVRALHSRRPVDVAAAIADNLDRARKGEGFAVSAILFLSALGALDAAFAVANGYLLERGPVTVDMVHAAGTASVNDQRRRKTMMLFVPPTAPMRTDARFLPLCEAIGLADYWRKSGHRPDFLKGRAVA